jgi:hypothetical protein
MMNTGRDQLVIVCSVVIQFRAQMQVGRVLHLEADSILDTRN